MDEGIGGGDKGRRNEERGGGRRNWEELRKKWGEGGGEGRWGREETGRN